MNSYEVINKCIEQAQAELDRIPDHRIKIGNSLTRYECVNGEFIKVEAGDRGESHSFVVGHNENEFIEGIIHDAVRRYAFSYECRHRRKFEDNRRQVNEIIEYCYGFFSKEYKYELFGNLKDNIHIYFDLLDYYVKVSKEYLMGNPPEGLVKRRLEFIAEKEYAGRSGGMVDVAFTFELVRYNIALIIEELPQLKSLYNLYEEKYAHLRWLERETPDNPEKYQLGHWSYNHFIAAEQFLYGNMTDDAESLRCAAYLLIVRIHTGRNVVKDVDKLIELSGLVDLSVFRSALEDLFVTDKYGVFRVDGRKEYYDYWEYGRRKLGLQEL